MMNEFRERLKRHQTAAWVFLLGYIAFNGCFVFPFSNELFSFDLQKAYMVAACYGIIGICFSGLAEQHKEFLVFWLSLAFTVIGMGLRYLLEYGEVSNTMNFTMVNVVLFIAVIPVYCMTVYWAVWKFCSNSAEY
mgnify:CR=1 FL=1